MRSITAMRMPICIIVCSDFKKNSFSFLANEEGPFNAYILLDDEIVQSKTVKLEESVSFTFENDLEYNKKYMI